ncbi:MAG: VOC family protein [Pleomorphochaeta sp.]
MSKIKKNVSKIVLVVNDIDKALNNFKIMFDFKDIDIVIASNDNKDPNVQTIYQGQQISGAVKIANLVMDNLIIELIQPIDKHSPWGKFKEENGEGIFSIVFDTNDFQKTREMLDKNEFDLFHFGSYVGGKYAYFNTKDKVGTTLCIQELQKQSE